MIGALLSVSLLFISSSAFLSAPDILRHSSKTATLLLTSTSPLSDEHWDDLPSIIKSPVLAKTYPAILKHKSKYGNPNIPLGSEDGKRCKTLRRLAFQNKLTPGEVDLLTDLGFRWNSFEDVYTECDFDEMKSKLMTYKEAQGTFQIPKKYELDPELGAWVTMLRRLYKRQELPQDEVNKMNEIQFEWTSSRQCGSSFMTRYREIQEQLNNATISGFDASKVVDADLDMKKWIHAQKCAFESGKLSESRISYMDDLGVDWKSVSV